jgi:hypothetical protein
MSATARNQVFSAVHTIGGLLPADMLVRIADGKDVSGSTPADYRVAGSRSVSDEAERHWDYLKAIWTELRQTLPVAAEAEAPADPTGLAYPQWLEPLFNELGFGLLSAVGAAGITADDGSKKFAISHHWKHLPIHLIPWNAKLDARPAPGAVPPQSLVQECLNRSDGHLWAVLSNGRQLRLLRDSSALATASYVEFDLEAIFDGELFSEFVLLYRLLHVSRFDVAEGATPSTCWLEKWRLDAITSGTRALDHLRDGVQQAITTLGTGFLRHPANAHLRAGLDVQAFHNALLRLVYRILFLFVIEDRDILHPARTDPQSRTRYHRYFSTARLRTQARRRRGTAHSDLYQGLTFVLDALGDEQGRPELGLPGLGGIFTGTAGKPADRPLRGLALQNEYLLAAVRQLAQVRDPGSRRWRPVDYRSLGSEELGSIYESLLELVPRHRPEDRSFALETLAGNSRKTTGSYYTPSALIECLLDATLDPVIDDAVKRGEQAASAAGEADLTRAVVAELLTLRVCDPACGSGHFLVAAARRIAKRVAAVRERNPEPTVDAVRHSLHEVIATCIYGVDLNPMAVELAKVSLWLEGMETGKALSFLDAHIKQGNTLLGATPALLRAGIPDEAFKPIEGDDRKHAKGLQRQNEEQRANQGSFFDLIGDPTITNSTFATELVQITRADADKLRQVRDQENAYVEWVHNPDYREAKLLADAWCAAFTWRKTPDSPPAITQEVFRSLTRRTLSPATQATYDEIERLRDQYAFFHWHLEFPDVFAVAEPDEERTGMGWTGGFHCIVGNPPWERVKLQEQEFFATRDTAIANANNKAHRDRLIKALANSPEEAERTLHAAFLDARRTAEGVSHLLRDSGRFPLAGRGDVNTYAVFAETASLAVAPRGRFGLVLPTGIATDATTAPFFSDLVRGGRLAAFLDFENEAFLLSRDVHHSVRFALFSATGKGERVDQASFAFGTRHIEDLDARRFAMPLDEILLVNPNTGTLPVFRTRRDAEITIGIYRRLPVLIRDGDPDGNPWNLSFSRMFDMANDSHLFRVRDELGENGWELEGNVFKRGPQRMLPLYEAKMLHHFDHRLGTYEGQTQAQANMGTLPRLTAEQQGDPSFVTFPRYWAPDFDVPTGKVDKKGKESYDLGVSSRLAERGWFADWLVGWRDVCRATDERTMIPAILPRAAVGHKFPLALPLGSPVLGATLYAILGSFALDYVGRQKLSGVSMGLFVIKQLPIPAPDSMKAHEGFVVPRVAELTCTSYDMTPFAEDLGIGDHGEPFCWNRERRAMIRCELDAYLFRLYGVDRDDVGYVLDSFPVVRRSDEARHGSYRTKELILAEYDRMVAAGLSLENPLVDGENYTSTLNPPPGHGPRHPAR